MSLPNKLTIFRIACAAVTIVFLLLGGAVFAWLALTMFCAAAVTDACDGHIARKTGAVTNFGKFADPLADKILNYSVMILLIGGGLIPPLALTLILFREFVVTGIRQLGAEQGKIIAANIWGKMKTVFQDFSLILILGLRACGVSYLDVLASILIWVCAGLTVISGVIYVWQNREVLKDE